MLRSISDEGPVEGSTPTVSFESQNEVTWYNGCENFRGKYYVTENDLTVPHYGVVGGDCMKPEAFEETDGTCVVAYFTPEGDYRLKDGAAGDPVGDRRDHVCPGASRKGSRARAEGHSVGAPRPRRGE